MPGPHTGDRQRAGRRGRRQLRLDVHVAPAGRVRLQRGRRRRGGDHELAGGQLVQRPFRRGRRAERRHLEPGQQHGRGAGRDRSPAATRPGSSPSAGADQTTFQKYGIDAAAWTPRANALGTVNKGGALTTDGAGTIYALRGDGTQAFWADNVATGAWTAKANTGQNVDGGRRARLPELGGRSRSTRRWAATSLQALQRLRPTPGTRCRARRTTSRRAARSPPTAPTSTSCAATTKEFFRYNVVANTWTTLAPLPVNVGWGGSLTYVGGSIYALSGDGKRTFFRYNIAANSWTPTLGPTARSARRRATWQTAVR